MKKRLTGCLALIALLGLIHCVVIEPAFACAGDKASSQEAAEDHGCFFCHASHHQWMSENGIQEAFDLSRQDPFLQNLSVPLREPPLRSIFHPPLKA